MGEVKHLCLVKFKEGVVVEDVLKGMTDLVAGMDMVKSFEWYYIQSVIHSFIHELLLPFCLPTPFFLPFPFCQAIKLNVFSFLFSVKVYTLLHCMVN